MTETKQADCLLALRHVRYAYPGREPVLDGVDFSLAEGERLALLGPNGCGKSTLLRLVVGLIRPERGTIGAFGQERTTEADFREVRRRVGLVFQNADDQLFCPTVLEDIAFGPLNLGRSPEQVRQDARAILECMGLEGFADRVTYKLSGGEKRLVALATVLVMKPDVLLLDEPTAGLDESSTERLCALLESLPQAMVIVSHERGIIDRLTHRVCSLEKGSIRAV